LVRAECPVLSGCHSSHTRVGAVARVQHYQQFHHSGVCYGLIPLAVAFFIFAFLEEVGWRGYLAPKVHRLDDGLLDHALVAVVWASWHLPYMRQLWSHTSEGLATLLPRFLLGTFVFAVVYGEIRIRTGSIWPAVLMHWLGNMLANTLLSGSAGAGFVSLVSGKEALGSFGVEGVFMILLFGLLGIYLYARRRQDARVQPEVLAGWTGCVAKDR